MSYSLQFYSLPQRSSEKPSPDPNLMPDFIKNHGRWVGEIEFAAGESHLFFEAAERFIKLSIFGLLYGGVRGVKPTKTSPEFGSLTEDVAEEAVQKLKVAVGKTATPEGYGEAAAIARDLNLQPAVFQHKLSLLCDLLEDALQGEGEPATIYN